MDLKLQNSINRVPRSKSEIDKNESVSTPEISQTPLKRPEIINEYNQNESLKEIAKTYSKAEIAQIAKHAGLNLKEEIQWTKHTYTVRPEYKELFKKLSLKLGKSMQFSMDEMFEDYFKKYKKQVDGLKAKNEETELDL